MNHGAGWIIYEESSHMGTCDLVSILPARRSAREVARFMEQIYTDRNASIRERLTFKKSPKSAPYKVTMGRHVNPMSIGHDPFLVGIYARKIALNGNSLDFVYCILTSTDDRLMPTFQEREKSLIVRS